MRGRSDKKGNQPAIVIRKEEVVEGGGHGGAWKVAYADFVTAMMAFFLLMWLLNATTEDQRKGLADYFSPNNLLSHASSGVGKPFGGHTAFDQGALVSDRGAVQATDGKRPIVLDAGEGDTEVVNDDQSGPADGNDRTGDRKPGPSATTPPPDATGVPVAVVTSIGQGAGGAEKADTRPAEAADRPRPPSEAELRAEAERREKAAFEAAAEQIRAAVRADPALADLAKQLAIDMTPEGLRIQLLDEDRKSMFAFGSATPNDRARLLLQKVTPVLARLTQPISIAGYTDAAPFAGPERTNWELSAERANATRRLLVDGGLPEGRIRTVTGHADRDPLLPADPLAAANRRMAIVVLRSAATEPLPKVGRSGAAAAGAPALPSGASPSAASGASGPAGGAAGSAVQPGPTSGQDAAAATLSSATPTNGTNGTAAPAAGAAGTTLAAAAPRSAGATTLSGDTGATPAGQAGTTSPITAAAGADPAATAPRPPVPARPVPATVAAAAFRPSTTVVPAGPPVAALPTARGTSLLPIIAIPAAPRPAGASPGR